MKNEESKVQSLNMAPHVQSVHMVAGLSSKKLKLGEIIHRKLNTDSRTIGSPTSDITDIFSI
jgi:hypothetical protein